MEEKVRISILLEIYGNLLTPKQNEYMDYYYNEDLSLSEIAENEGITRQAVMRILQKSSKKLEEYEKKLKFMQKEEIISECINKIMQTKLNNEQEKIIKNIKEQIDF